MAQKGIATAAIQYRFAPESRYPAQLNDIRNATKFVVSDRERFRVNSDRIIWMGGSAGGHLALMAGLEQSDIYKTTLIINVAGPTDLRNFKSLPSGDETLKRFVTRNSSELLTDLLGTADRAAEIYTVASPVEFVRSESPRVVTFHGEKDDIVPISQAEALHSKLREMNVSEKLTRSQSGGHDFATWEASDRLNALLEVVREIESAAKGN